MKLWIFFYCGSVKIFCKNRCSIPILIHWNIMVLKLWDTNGRGNFTNKKISIYRKLLHVSARGWQSRVATSVLINVGKVLLMSSDFIKGVFLVHTHTQLLAKRHGPEWSIRGQILFSPIFLCYPHPKTHVDPKKKTETKIN